MRHRTDTHRAGFTRHRLGLIALLASLVGLALPVSVGAAPTWLSPVTLSQDGEEAYVPQVAFDPLSNALVVWEGSDGTNNTGIHAAFRPAGGAFGAPQAISAADAIEPQVALDPHGNALAVWARHDGAKYRVEAAFRPAGGSFGAAQTLSDEGQNARAPRLAFDPQGNAIVVWFRSDGTNFRIQAAFRPAGASFGAPQNISEPDRNAFEPRVAVDAQGNALAMWRRFDGTNFRIQAALRPAGGGFGEAQTVSEHGQEGDRPEVAVNPRGDAIAVWRAGGNDGRVQAAFRPAGGSFGAPQTISEEGQGTLHPQVAIDPQGNALAAWHRFDNGPFYVEAAFRPAGESFAAAKRLSEASHAAFEPQPAFDAQGNALIVWTRQDDNSIQAALRPAGGTLGAPQAITQGTGDPRQPQVAFDTQGNAIAVWRDDRARAAGFDAAGPQLRDLVVPAQGAVGNPLSFSVSPLDVWSPVAATSWSFGDGSAAAGARVAHAYATAGAFGVTVTATDGLGNASTAARTVSVTTAPAAPAVPTPAPPPSPYTLPPPRLDSTPPALAGLRLSPRSFRAARRGASIATRIGTTIRYRLSERARVRFAVERAAAGRRVGGRCRRPTARNRSGRPCVRFVGLEGSFSHAGRQGPNRFRFTGRLRQRSLRPGRYQLVARATDPAGNRSRPRRARFSIVRR